MAGPSESPSRGVINKKFGGEGEDMAADYLKGRGFRILERNYRCRLGEVDLIVEDKKGNILFVEVKSRHLVDSVSPLELISPAKQRHISRAAQHYTAMKRLDDRNMSFALLAVDGSQGTPRFELVEDAFLLAWGY